MPFLQTKRTEADEVMVQMSRRIGFSLLLLMLCTGTAVAQSKGGGPPARPGIVVVAEVLEGASQPVSELVGTVFFARESEVAAEVEGRVVAVNFEEGQRVRAGTPLVELDTGLLDLVIEQTGALHEQSRVELENARKDFERMASLYRERSIAVSVYDDARFEMLGLEQKVAALGFELEHERLMRRKMRIVAPFDGVVVRKDLDPGEWVSPGSVIGMIADDRQVDVVVDVPEPVLEFLEVGRKIPIRRGNWKTVGRLSAVVPKGDVATRTFRVKIRMTNTSGMLEGMEALARLPSGPRVEGLLVPRDAVISKFGRNVVFIELEGAAKMIPVQVQGYEGLMAGVAGPGLAAGQKVVVKGNERIMDGQPLQVVH